MFKRLVILVMLSSILIALLVVNFNKADDDSSNYIKIEYEITDINGDYYYATDEEGTEIRFSSEKIVSGDKVEIHDKVIGLFEKGNFAGGLVRVEKK